ncbi:MAG: hypothetical protein R3F61_12435 [Myxococcota bacterium]
MVLASAFPFSTLTWVLLWVVPGAVLGGFVSIRMGFLRNLEQSSGAGEAVANRMVMRAVMAACILPSALVGWASEDVARDAWNARFGTCLQLMPAVDAELLLKSDLEADPSEHRTSCRVDYRVPGEREPSLTVEVETFGSPGTAFEQRVSRLRGSPMILDLPWSRSYTVVRKDAPVTPRSALAPPEPGDGRIVALLELRDGAVLVVDVRRSLSSEELWRLVDGLAKREPVVESLLK